MKYLHASLVLFGLSLITASPIKSEEESRPSYASRASQIIATNLLKSYNDIDGNQVHSPLGVTTMLAILAEATQGDTYEEFYKVLGYPKERGALRDSFRTILSKYQTKILGEEPSFQTWLYIYRNFTAREDFKKLVEENYYVDVKDISRDEFDNYQPDTYLDVDGTTSNSKDVIGFETLKRLKLHDDGRDDALGFTTVSAHTDNYGEEMIEKETSKFDRFVDDKQYVEKPQIIDEIKNAQRPQQQEETQTEVNAKVTTSAISLNEDTKRPAIEVTEKLESLDDKLVVDANSKADNVAVLEPKEQSKHEDNLNLEENETVQKNEKILKTYKEDEEAEADANSKILVPIQEVLESNEPEKVTLPLQKLENVLDEVSKGSPAEIMLALEKHVSSARSAFGSRSLFRSDDITSALSANSITGRDINSKTKMLLFNGLYFRGNWANEFREERNADEFFFMTSDDAIKTPMMHARGKFYMAELENLNAKVICLPYENKRYSLMIVLPNELEGLHTVIAKLEPSDLNKAKSGMREQDLHIVLPKFQIEETSRSESMLKSLGLTRLFSRNDADLSLLSDDRDLHVDEIVQFVNVKVDEGGSSNIALSASDTQARDNESFQNIEINHPFAYFVMDCEQDFILVSGKVHAPEVQEELPVGIEVEFEKS